MAGRGIAFRETEKEREREMEIDRERERVPGSRGRMPKGKNK
jgi:hypothetical protein